MKDGSLYADRVRKRFAKLEAFRDGEDTPPQLSDPLHQLAAAILGAGEGEAAGRRALDLIFQRMIDWNEVRVSSPVEVAAVIGRSLPQAQTRCERLRRALNDIFEKENVVSLERVKSLRLREARSYLASIDAVDGYAVASVVLWSLGGHAIPVDDLMLKVLRKEELVHPEATREEVQAFLERAIAAVQAKSFCKALQHLAGPDKKQPAGSRKPAASRRRKTAGGGAQVKRAVSRPKDASRKKSDSRLS